MYVVGLSTGMSSTVSGIRVCCRIRGEGSKFETAL